MPVDAVLDQTPHLVWRDRIQLAAEVMRPRLVLRRQPLRLARWQTPEIDLGLVDRDLLEDDLDAFLIPEARQLLFRGTDAASSAGPVEVAQVVDVIRRGSSSAALPRWLS